MSKRPTITDWRLQITDLQGNLKPHTCNIKHQTSNCYSVLKLCTGFADAVLIV